MLDCKSAIPHRGAIHTLGPVIRTRSGSVPPTGRADRYPEPELAGMRASSSPSMLRVTIASNFSSRVALYNHMSIQLKCHSPSDVDYLGELPRKHTPPCTRSLRNEQWEVVISDPGQKVVNVESQHVLGRLTDPIPRAEDHRAESEVLVESG